ncbi:cupin domain-containing protein [Micromonospora sp. 067-2]|uniref:cupin domain-containing protein n=1 Tax=Micromonospora sp. 067-2 TaxID=2789270 RepID=UPI00397BA4A7
MLVRQIGDDQLQPGYGVRYQQIYPHGHEDLADWGIGRAVLDRGDATTVHAHPENEIFLILSGRGDMTVGAQRLPVVGGEAVVIPADTHHQLVNTGAGPLVLVSVYWPPAFGRFDL